MSEWVIENAPQESNDSEWIVEQPEQSKPPQKEDLAVSTMMAIPRIGSDIFSRGLNAIRSIPEYLTKARTEIPGALNLMQENPQLARSQFRAGFAEHGKNVFNFPHDLINYAANRLNLFPKSWNEKVQMGRMPEDTNQMINEFFNVQQPDQPGEGFLRGAGRNVNAVAALGRVIPELNPLKYKSSNIAKNIVNTESDLGNIYSKKYENIFNKSDQLNLGRTLGNIIPQLDLSMAMRNEPSLSKVSMHEFITNPTSRTAHEFKSDLLGIQRKLNRKYKTEGLSGGESKKLDAVNHAITNIEENMFTDVSGTPHKKIANTYRKTQEGYERQYLPYLQNRDIQKYKEGKLLPHELIPSLRRGEFAAMRGKSHPELFRPIMAKNALNAIKYVAPSAGSLGVLLYLLSQGK